MEITVVLSQENETLPKVELLSRLETLDIKYTILNEYPGIIELDVGATWEDIVELGSHLGYTHEILKTISKTTPEKLEESTLVERTGKKRSADTGNYPPQRKWTNV